MEHEVSLKQQDVKFKSLKGFTLLEMVISISILALVATATSVFFNQSLVAYRYSADTISVAQEAGLAMKWIVDDIESPTTTNITAPTGPNEITIVVAGINIHYYMDATDPQNITIQRAEGVTPPSLLAEHVQVNGLSFHYYNLTNGQIAYDDPQLKTVEIDIVTQRHNQVFRLNSVAGYTPP